MTISRRPRAFIGSSAEAIPIARAVAEAIERQVEVNAWYANTFQANDYTMEALERELDANDFGIFVFAAEDVATIRNETHFITRDNTLYEMGLFWGRLGRRRVFCLVPSVVPQPKEAGPASIHLPSDLDGLTLLRYDAAHSRGPHSGVSTACGRILTAMRSEGPFKQRHEILAESETLVQRKDSVLHFFWEFLKNVDIADAEQRYAAYAEAIRNSILPPAGYRTTGAALWKLTDDGHIRQVGGNVGRGRTFPIRVDQGRSAEDEPIIVVRVHLDGRWSFFSRRAIADVHVLCYPLGSEHVLSVHFSGSRPLAADRLKEIVEMNDDLLATVRSLIGGDSR
ncbi:nucleotide-binding protein [Paenibacillus sp. FSL W8-1187]|uniref:nucleotide-binding protein n=1 Tax=Paenibacillus sp. FSL W8-1187 TaxID=2975339 RepID=UPI0030D764FD